MAATKITTSNESLLSDNTTTSNESASLLLRTNTPSSRNSISSSIRHTPTKNNNEIVSKDGGEQYSSFTKLSAAFSYGITSIAIQLVNKITLTTYEFPSANAVALAQCVFVVVALSLGKAFGYIQYPSITYASIKAVMPLPLIQILNVSCGLFGTKAISIPMFTTLRRISVPLTLLSEVYLLKLPVSRRVKLSVALLMAGAVVAAMNDLSFDATGYAAIFTSAVATTAYGTLSKVKLSSMTKWEVLYINSIVSIPFFSLLLNLNRNTMSQLYDFPSWSDPWFLLFFLMTSCLGFWLNFFILFNTQVNGPLSTTVVGTTKNIFTTYAGMLGSIGGDYVFSWPNFIGLNVSMGGALCYSAAKILEQRTTRNDVLLPIMANENSSSTSLVDTNKKESRE
eukprot:CAMPEP_0194143780 /NCGR_PEP_ID=MMETSP0152-20130528/12886_1 /TAXON_ID=1049557 /ORGANISM="Thalassiothrix antarctica, Strain L6-D1" /LENGTH=395 /DNA_ID=CAMNT_0038843329 /DNA_START=115 /DNA_END=1302 /DNA_ORIENTATION=-